MKINGNLDVQGTINQPQLESFDAIDLPVFNPDDKGTLYFNNDLGSVTINDGSTYVTLMTNQTSNQDFVNTLGSNWINSNLSFNPVPFNNMDNIDGLTANSSLFDVVSQLDGAISNITSGSINDNDDVNTDGAVNGTILVFSEGGYIVGNINDISDNFEFNFEQLNDVTLTDLTENDTISYNGSGWVNIKKSFTYENLLGTLSIFDVNHELGVRYCHVSVIDRNTETLVDGPIVTYLSDNLLRVETKNNLPVTILVQAP